MSKIKLYKRIKYAGDIHDELMKIGWDSETAAEFLNGIPDVPKTEYSPVEHGRWAHIGGNEWCCTNCGFIIFTEGSWEKPINKRCEECGARMDEEG